MNTKDQRNPFRYNQHYNQDNRSDCDQNQRNYNRDRWEDQRFNFTKFRDEQNTKTNRDLRSKFQGESNTKTSRNLQSQHQDKQNTRTSRNLQSQYASNASGRRRRSRFKVQNSGTIFNNLNEKTPASDIKNQTENSKIVFDSLDERSVEPDINNEKYESVTEMPGSSSSAVIAKNQDVNVITNKSNVEGKHIDKINSQQSTPIKSTINKKLAKSSSSDSSSSSSSDSNESVGKNLKNEFKTNSDKTDNPKQVNAIKTEKSLTSVNVIKKEESKPKQTLEISSLINKPNYRSTSSSSNDSDSTDDRLNRVDTKRKSPSEEDVICLGKVENFENLVDDDDEPCLLCNGKGHTSFFCQTICRNCGEKYHSFKSCPKPANISVVLQQFMEFFMKQFCSYNPNKQLESISPMFSQINEQESNNGPKKLHSRDETKISGNTSRRNHKSSSEDSDSSSDTKKKRKRSKNPKKTKNLYQSRTTQFMPAFGKTIPLNYSSSNNSDSENSSMKRRKTSKHLKRTNIDPSLFPSQQMAFIPPPQPFNQSIPFGYGTPNLSFNPMIAFKQMMGFNPALNFTTNSDKEK